MSALNRWLRGTRPYGTQKQSETPGVMAGQSSNHKFMRASHQFIKSSNTHFDFGYCAGGNYRSQSKNTCKSDSLWTAGNECIDPSCCHKTTLENVMNEIGLWTEGLFYNLVSGDR